MKTHMKVLAGAMFAAMSSLSMAQLVGVSWSNFQEERWTTDEKAIKDQLAKLGGSYVSVDAAASAEKQIADIDGLLNKGAKVLLVLAMDKDAIAPALAKAKSRGVPVIAYDRLIENPDVFYISFDNKEVGRMQARAIQAVKPKGNYAMIKGASTDPNADLLRSGQQEVLGDAIKKGDIKIVGEEYTDGWKPEVAQKNMEQILTKAGGKVDAVVCSNDGMAGGVIAALSSKGLTGIPVSGQDGDHAALNRVAKGLQTVSVWKDSRELGKTAATVAMALAKGQKPEGAGTFNGGEKKISMNAILLKPLPVTADKLGEVIAGGWITKEEACQGVDKATGPAACK